jgi:hypothetical protein
LQQDGPKLKRHVENYDDVDHHINIVRVIGMQAHTEKNLANTIQTQIKNLRENADVYKSVHGEEGYNDLLVSLINKMTVLNKKLRYGAIICSSFFFVMA